MFARTAQIMTLGCRAPARAEQQSSKIHDAVPPRRQPVLRARWRLDPATGRPICAWEIEAPSLAADLDADPGWSDQEPKLVCIAVLPRSRAAAGSFRPRRQT